MAALKDLTTGEDKNYLTDEYKQDQFDYPETNNNFPENPPLNFS